MTTAAKIPSRESAAQRLHVVGTGFDVEKIRRDFPILSREIRGKKLVYLDNAATAQKPRAVIEAISRYYEQGNANVHRGVHFLSEHATGEHERARRRVQRFINAPHASEIIFVRGATEAINLVAQTYGRVHVSAGDEVLITAMEHHSNIVPWQILCEEKGAKLRVAPINDDGELLLDEFEKLLGPRTKIVAVSHVSNALGTHKMFGPIGIGVLFGKSALLEDMPPYQGGGDMISSVTFEKTIYNKLPFKFEAGTPNVAGAIALGAAIEYLNRLGMDNIAAYEHELLAYATEKISAIPGVRLIGTARERAGVLSFVIEGIHPHDVGTVLDQEGIAIRTGHHCAQPVMQRFGVPATARASFALYNTKDEVDVLAEGILKVQEVFA